MNAAIVIGVDDYGAGASQLGAAVRDAEKFFAWVVSRTGGNVPRRYARLLLARRADDPPPNDPRKQAHAVATKDNVVTAINELVTASEAAESGPWDRLYFYFSGHGITARVANRDEAALVTPGFDALHPDHSLAVRSLIEFFETTRFRDQFFFLDACRDDPWEDREYEIGRWPIPRRRNPGEPPVQQFILHAVPSGVKAQEALEWWPGEGVGEFSDVLMAGLRGNGEAKAWSWERSRYEVRWERLAGYVKAKMEAKKLRSSVAGHARPADGWPIQVPQDTGSRGVAGRDRDALLVAFPRSRRFRAVTLTVELKGGRRAPTDVSVRDAAGESVASALKVPGTAHEFTLPPKTYAVSAEAKGRRGSVKWPIELYDARTEKIELEAEPSSGSQATDRWPSGAGTGRIAVEPPDPLTVTELRDEAGTLSSDAGVPVKMGDARFRVPAGFYRVRLLGPEPEAMTEEQRIVLRGGEPENVRMQDFAFPRASTRALELARAAGGTYDAVDHSVRLASERLQWAQPSTIVAVALGDGLASTRGGPLRKLGLEAPRTVVGGDSGIAVYAVPAKGPARDLRAFTVREWEAGAVVPQESTRLEPSKSGVAGFVARVEKPGPRWLAIERDGAAVVVALPVLAGRLATVIAQVEPGQLRLYQHHPAIGGGPSATARAVRRAEHLQRMILGGRLDAAQALATELAKAAREDPFAGCLAGYALLRFGIDDRDRAALLARAIDAVIEVAPTLSDGYVLRAQYEAAAGNNDGAAQAFADAVNVGVPAFGEGLTRLIEGLRVTSFLHPRGALIRHIFQRHARGTMWSAFTPVRPLQPGTLVVSGADLGFEG